MKHLITTTLLALFLQPAVAQNFQLHYDFGRAIYSNTEATRPNVTLTYEQFTPDALGNWFWFVDFDMYHDGMKGAYAEISREFTLASNSSSSGSLAAHIEYDGGMTTYRYAGGSRFQNSALVGPAWNAHNSDYSLTWSLQALYKQYFKAADATPAYASFQLTGVWGYTFANGHCTTSGYIDLWRGRQANGHGQLIVMGEPQFWYNFNKHFSVGTEVEVSNNFVYADCATARTWYINPTVAVKYNF